MEFLGISVWGWLVAVVVVAVWLPTWALCAIAKRADEDIAAWSVPVSVEGDDGMLGTLYAFPDRMERQPTFYDGAERGWVD